MRRLQQAWHQQLWRGASPNPDPSQQFWRGAPKHSGASLAFRTFSVPPVAIIVIWFVCQVSNNGPISKHLLPVIQLRLVIPLPSWTSSVFRFQGVAVKAKAVNTFVVPVVECILACLYLPFGSHSGDTLILVCCLDLACFEGPLASCAEYREVF